MYVERSCILFALRERCTVAKAAFPPPRRLELAGEVYTQSPPLDWVGLYDWLRARDGTFLGVCLWPFDQLKYVCSLGRAFAYTTDGNGLAIDIFVGARRGWDQAASTQYESESCAVYVSDAGGFAFAFAATELTEADLRTIRESPDVDWLEEAEILESSAPGQTGGG